jgi:integrase
MTIMIQAKEDWHTKNYRSRIINMTPVLYDILREHREQYISDSVQCEYVFTYNGQRLRSNIKRSLIRVMNDAGLKGVTLHTLRHTFASQLAMAGVSLRDVQELMGHRSYETTLQYAHLSQDHVKQQVMKLPFAHHSTDSRTRIGHAGDNFTDALKNEKPCETLSSQGL